MCSSNHLTLELFRVCIPFLRYFDSHFWVCFMSSITGANLLYDWMRGLNWIWEQEYGDQNHKRSVLGQWNGHEQSFWKCRYKTWRSASLETFWSLNWESISWPISHLEYTINIVQRNLESWIDFHFKRLLYICGLYSIQTPSLCNTRVIVPWLNPNRVPSSFLLRSLARLLPQFGLCPFIRKVD